MKSVACRVSTPWITALGAGEEVTFTPVRNHIDTCLNCQAGVARQRRVRRSLEDLGSVAEVAPAAHPSFGSTSDGNQARQALFGAVGAAIVVGVGVIGLRRVLAD